MTRNLKVLGLALVAVFALAAVVASSASAAAFKCTSNNHECVLTGTTETSLSHEQFFSGGEEPFVTECHGKFAATQGAESVQNLTVTPVYSECLNNEHVRVNHCAYIFNVTTTNGDGKVEVECETGSKIELDRTGVCTLTFGAQAGLTGGVHYTNTGNSTVTVESTVGNVVYSKSNQTGNQFFCGLVPNGPGEYHSKATVHCYEDTGEALTGTKRTTPTFTAEMEGHSETGTTSHSEGLASCHYEA